MDGTIQAGRARRRRCAHAAAHAAAVARAHALVAEIRGTGETLAQAARRRGLSRERVRQLCAVVGETAATLSGPQHCAICGSEIVAVAARPTRRLCGQHACKLAQLRQRNKERQAHRPARLLVQCDYCGRQYAPRHAGPPKYGRRCCGARACQNHHLVWLYQHVPEWRAHIRRYQAQPERKAQLARYLHERYVKQRAGVWQPGAKAAQEVPA